MPDGPCMPTCVADRMLDHDGAAKGAGANPRGRHGFARIFLCEGADTRVLYLNIGWEIFTPDGSGLSSLTFITHITSPTSCFCHTLSSSSLAFLAFSLYKSYTSSPSTSLAHSH